MSKTNKNLDNVSFTNKEEEAMRVLWSSNHPMSATEIAESIPDRKWPINSIQNILRTLEKKHAIEIAEITKLGKSYGRLFRATISANEYATMQFKRYYQTEDHDELSLVSALLGKNNSKEEIIEVLQTLLEKYEEE